MAAAHPVTVGLPTTLLMERSAALRGEVVATSLIGGGANPELERALRALGYVE